MTKKKLLPEEICFIDAIESTPNINGKLLQETSLYGILTQDEKNENWENYWSEYTNEFNGPKSVNLCYLNLLTAASNFKRAIKENFENSLGIIELTNQPESRLLIKEFERLMRVNL